ncbi:glycoside hydrolase family 99-like domain-containing protein [Rhizobium sp. 2YAF20]|uniref:glycoside hydrolase family 99-like domain-containing protein n=1 Tax=Rhizobium sp. 2YAF20 TaxID=3233027 RepID=UPI003F9C01F6
MINPETDEHEVLLPDVMDRLTAESPDLVQHLRGESYLSRRHRLLYVSTPKAACTTLKWWFASLEGYAQSIHEATDSNQSDPELAIHDLSLRMAPHVTGLGLEDLKEPLVSEQYFRFAVVRNPYKRVFSAWQSKLLLREPLQAAPYADSAFFHYPVNNASDITEAFEAFLEHLAANEAPSFWDHHWTPQFNILRPDLIDYSVIAKIEQPSELSAPIMKWIGQYATDPFGVRRANESLIPYLPEFLTDRSAELVARLYSADFDSFGYDRKPPVGHDSFSPEQMHLALQAIALIRARHHQLGERDARIATLSKALSVGQVEITNLQHSGEALGEQIASLNLAINRQSSEIARMVCVGEQREHQVAQLVGQVVALSAAAERRTNDLANLANSIAERDAAIAHLTNEAATRLIAKDSEIRVLQRSLLQMRQSISGQLTLPINIAALRRLLRKKTDTNNLPNDPIQSGLERIFRSSTRKIQASSLFDAEFYRSAYPDLRDSDRDLATHYLIHGWREHRNPSALFNTAQYLADNQDVEAAGINPLIHYLKHGRREGRQLTPAPTPVAVAHSPIASAECEAGSSVVELNPVYRTLSDEELETEITAIRASGMFDTSFYVSMYSDLGLTQDLAIRHYCEHGWQEGRNPSDEFDTRFYLGAYSDIRNSGLNPFWHYVTAGQVEQRNALSDYSPQYENDARFGKIDTSIQLLAFYTVPDWSRVRGARPVFKGHDCPLLPGEELGYYESADPQVLARHAAMARSHGLAGFYFKIDDGDTGNNSAVETLLAHNEIDIAFCIQIDLPSGHLNPAVTDHLAKAFRDPRQIHVESRPVLLVDIAAGLDAKIPIALDILLQNLKKAQLSAPFIIGRVDNAVELKKLPKWLDAVTDLPQRWTAAETAPFVPVKRNGVETVPYSVVAANGVMRAQGCANAKVAIYHSVALARDTTSQTGEPRVVYTRFQKNDYRRWLDAAMQSAATLHTPDRRFVFLNAWNDWNEGLCLEPEKKGGFNRLNETSRSLLGLGSDIYMPKVSVVVPNYNHGAYLRRRLDSIYGQTYKNMEVIILDDCSSDDSRTVIEEYQKEYADLTRVIVNEKNSGSAFRQWARGIEAASGEVVWIAESDDFCDEHFLRTLVDCLADESVMLAYGASVFVDREEVPMDNDFWSYLEDLVLDDKWRKPYVATAHDEVRTALGIKNTIPNASGAIFRRPLDMPLLNDETWLSMRVAGDWVFYLHVLRGGKIAFDPKAINFFRRYEGSTAEVTYKKDSFYKEVGFASRTVAALYDVPWKVLERCRDGYAAVYQRLIGRSADEFDSWYNYRAVVEARQSRLPNIMVSTMGFFPGGAEILPIRMANEFKRQGHSVLLLSSNLNPRQDGVRRMLRNDVPVVETADVAETEEIISSFGIEALNTHQWHIQKYPLEKPEVFDRLNAHVASLHGMIEHGEAFAVTEAQLAAADQKVTTWVYTADKNLAPFIELGLYHEGSPRFIKMPNGMQPPKIVPIRRAEINIPEDAFVLCCVSRAIPDKGWAEAIDAVSMARQISGLDIQLILVGNGQVYDEYCRVGVPDFVRLAGFSENSVGYYAAADMGIMLTKFKSESFPLTIVDCLFAGKPYIATDVGEIRNMLSNGDEVAGAVLELNDWEVPVQETANIIVKFASRAEDYLDAKDRVSEIVQRYRIDVVAAQYVELFAAGRDGGRLGDRIGTN